MAAWDGYAKQGDSIKIIAVFPNTYGGFTTGLSATVTIAMDLAGSALVSGAAMTESSALSGIYYYAYTVPASGFIYAKATSSAGESICTWIVGTGTIPDMASATALQTVDDNVDAIKSDTDAYLDAAVSSRLASADYTAPDNEGIDTLESRLTSARAGYIDKLNVSGTLAHSDDANTYKADVSALATAANLAIVDGVVDAIKLKTDLIPADPVDSSDLTGLSTFDPATDTVIVGNPNDCKADVSALATSAEIAALNDISAADVWSAATRTLTDKTDFAMTTAEKTAIATAVWSAVTRTLTAATGGGATAQEIWEYAQRTLTDPDSYKADLTTVLSSLTTILTRITVERALLFDKLNVAGDLANTANADLFKADSVEVDLSGIALETSVQAIKTKTDLIPLTPASETQATANKQEILTAISGIDDSPTDLSGLALQSTLLAVKAKTDNLPVSPASETTSLAIKAKTDALPSDPADQSAVVSAITAAASPLAKETTAQAVKAKTDNLPAIPASEPNATANKQAILDAVNGVGAEVVNIYNTTENINNVTNILAAGSGTEKLTVTLYHDGTENPITGASVSVYYSDTLQASGISGMDGKIEFGLNSGGPYEVRINAPVLSFPITTVDAVSGTVEVVIYGAVISLTAPPTVEDCLIYEYLTGYNTETDAVHTAGYANIITPYSYAGRLYEGLKVPGEWNDTEKRLEWVMPRGAIVEFTLDWHGVKRHKIKIPNAGFARLYDVKPWKGK